MSLQAYQSAAQRAEDPRQAEYRLFGQVTRALMEAAEAPDTDFAARIEALDWNRRLWSALASDCASDENRLTPPLRAQIISLSLWVNRHSSAVMARKESFQPLIDVNRTVMQGLAPRPEPA
jgi:flagellar biosynthesis activator protein FlaF